MMIVFSFIPIALLILIFNVFKAFRRNAIGGPQLRSPARKDRDGSKRLDGAVFSLAKRFGGRITLSDVVVETGMALAEADRYMNTLVDHAHVSVEVDDNGRLTYEFPELLDESGGIK